MVVQIKNILKSFHWQNVHDKILLKSYKVMDVVACVQTAQCIVLYELAFHFNSSLNDLFMVCVLFATGYLGIGLLLKFS